MFLCYSSKIYVFTTMMNIHLQLIFEVHIIIIIVIIIIIIINNLLAQKRLGCTVHTA